MSARLVETGAYPTLLHSGGVGWWGGVGGETIWFERRSTCALGNEIVNHLVDSWASVPIQDLLSKIEIG